MNVTPRNRALRLCCWLLVAICWSGIPAMARACSTPVYRYAMYNWAPGSYEVYYFYRGEPLKDDAEVLGALSHPRDADQGEAANIILAKVNLDRKGHLDRLPPWVQKAWEPRAKTVKPVYLMMTPWGAELFSGQLDTATLKAMLDSPLRRRIGKLLHEGHAALFLVVSPPGAEKTKQAEKMIDEIIALMAAAKPKDAQPKASLSGDDLKGARKATSSDKDEHRPADTGQDDTDAVPPLKIARLTVSPNDPAEKWLIRMLMLSEKDLEEESHQPFVFAVFGRGRALPPLIGEGITADNLGECMAYVSGPCSCQIKDQNIGGDLLMTWNWDATAEKLAAEEPPDPSEGADSSPGQASMASTDAGKSPGETESVAVKPAVALPAQRPSQRSEVAAIDAVLPPEQGRVERSVDRYVRKYVLGIGVAVVVVLAGGWLLVRRYQA